MKLEARKAAEVKEEVQAEKAERLGLMKARPKKKEQQHSGEPVATTTEIPEGLRRRAPPLGAEVGLEDAGAAEGKENITR